MQPNTLYFGDNLQVLREQFPDACVDLVYLDPPFNSKRDYNYIYRDLVGAGDVVRGGRGLTPGGCTGYNRTPDPAIDPPHSRE